MTITIKADGSIFPAFSPISTADNVTYILTDNIASDTYGITIDRSNIILEGNGHTLQGLANGTGLILIAVRNVTIKNLVIAGFDFGLVLGYASNNTLSDDNVTSRLEGVFLGYSFDNNLSGNSFSANEEYGIELRYSSGNILSGNNITNNFWGILLISSSNNTLSGNSIDANSTGIRLSASFGNKFYHNSFSRSKWHIDNWDNPNLANVWDNGSEGNYWSDYKGIDSNHDGIGDTPYVIDANNIDHYPLMAQYTIPEFPSFLIMPIFMVTTLLVIVICKRKHLT